MFGVEIFFIRKSFAYGRDVKTRAGDHVEANLFET